MLILQVLSHYASHERKIIITILSLTIITPVTGQNTRDIITTTQEMCLKTNRISVQLYLASRALIRPARCSNFSTPLPYRSRAWAGKSSASRFLSSTSPHSDSAEGGPDELIVSLRADLKNSMKIKDVTQRDVIKVCNLTNNLNLAQEMLLIHL